MEKRTAYIITIICMLLSLTGCGFKDIDKRYFVVTAGVDKTKDKNKPYNVIFKLAVPSGQPKMGQEDFVIVEETTKTISDAARILKARVDKEPDYGHTKAILFGTSMERKDIETVLDWFVRRRDIQKISWIAMADPSAKEIMKVKPKSERLPSNAIFLSFGNAGSETPYTTSVYLFDFRRKLTDKGYTAYLPIISAAKKGQLVEVLSTVVLGEKKNVMLSTRETKHFNVLRGQGNKLELEAEMDGNRFMVNSFRPKVKYKLHIPHTETPYVEFTVKIDGILEETTAEKDVRTELPKYEKALEKTIEKRMIALLQKLQKEKVDPLGFGMRYRATHMGEKEKKWTAWEKLYPQLEFRVNIDATIRSTGLIE